jgi:ABC-type multidrug transport system ATPase subunit
VIGHNGAGKTTLFHLILGFKFASRGEIRIFGKLAQDHEARKPVAYVPERPYLNLDLRFREFLNFHAALAGMNGARRQDEVRRVASEVGLESHLDQTFKTFSKGMLQKALIAQASIGHPALIILDEPMSGLDPDARMMVKDQIKKWKAEGRTIIFSSHVVEDVKELADRALVLKAGSVEFLGAIEDWSSHR